MKPIDLSKAKLLKMILSWHYESYNINHNEIDTCILARMVIIAIFSGISNVIIFTCLISVLLLLVGFILLPLSLLTLYLPEGYQVPYEIMQISYEVVLPLIWVVFPLVVGISKTVKGDMPLAPTYLTKHFKTVNKPKEKKPSPTWLAIKEMYKSIKDKTCVKVKL